MTAELLPHGRRQVDPSVLARAGELLDDGCSVREVCATLGIDKVTVNRHFPGRAWPRQQVCDFANAVKRANNPARRRKVS